MTDEQGYNGWKNYETWAVALWIDNEEWSYNETRSQAQVFTEDPEDERNGRTVEGVYADWLKEYVEETMPDLGASLWSDLLNAAFGEVDWYEIAENYLSEIEEGATT